MRTLLLFVLLSIFTFSQEITFQEVQKFLASDTHSEIQFGEKVSTSGEYTIIGAVGGAMYDGAAYIYERDENGYFNEVAKLVDMNSWGYDAFGRSVSISGNYAIVGAANDADFTGIAYIYKREENGDWSEVIKLSSSDYDNDWSFGNSVSISGNYAIVGASNEDEEGDGAGSAYVYKLEENGTWVAVNKLYTPDAQSGDHFGESVSISGNYVIVGAPNEDEGGYAAGAAYIFKLNENGASYTVNKLLANDAQDYDDFGESVSISGDYAVIGARSQNESGNNAGAAYIFKRDENDNWYEVKKLLASDAESDDNFGESVSISGDYVVVGAPLEDEGGSGAGAAYIYKLDENGNWYEANKLLSSDVESGDHFGRSVSISGDYMVVGAPIENEGGDYAGAAYSFRKREESSGEITVIYPNGGEIFDAGTTRHITWTSENVNNVRIEYKSDNEKNWQVIIENTPSDGEFDWVIPDNPSETCSIRITDISPNTYQDVSDSFFTIRGYFPEITSITPNSGSHSGETGVSLDGQNFGDTRGRLFFGGVPVVKVEYWSDTEIECITPPGVAGLADVIVSKSIGLRDTIKNGYEYIETTSGYEYTEIKKLLASNTQYAGLFGSSVSICGEYAIVGAVGDSEGGSNAGAAYIYQRDENGDWSEVAKLLPFENGIGLGFGSSVSIFGDYAIVSVPYEDMDGVGPRVGAAYIFKRDQNGSWLEAAKIRASDAQTFDEFGISVCLSDEYAIVGAQDEDEGGNSAGAAYIYKRDENDNWYEVEKLIASDAEVDGKFGNSVSISGDYAIVGAPGENVSEEDAGAAYIYKRDENNNWYEVEKLTSSDSQSNDFFGDAVSISGDYAIVGAPGENVSEEDAGAAYIYKRDENNNWYEVEKLTSSDSQSNDHFGSNVSISGDYAIVGAYGEDEGGNSAGAAYIYKRAENNNWYEVEKLISSDSQSNDYFGSAVSISGDYAFVGAWHEDEGGYLAGATYIFRNKETVASEITMTINVNSSWNLVSVPLDVENMAVASLFPQASSQAFEFNNGYVTVDELSNGKGYWLKFDNPGSDSITGMEIINQKIGVQEGWNIIGPFENSVSTSEISSEPDGIISSQFFGFNNGYVLPDELVPGKGYWIKASQSGNLNISGNKAAKQNYSLSKSEDWVTLVITDAQNNTQELYLTESAVSEYFATLPPVPPMGIFDVRFDTDRKYELAAADNVVKISTINYPVTISVNGSYLRIDDNIGSTVVNKLIRDGESLTLPKSINQIKVQIVDVPTEFALEQNYPNPFNPSTTIKFGMPEDNKVTLELYNILGEKIATYLDKQLTAGYHEFKIDASELSSGVYIYRIVAGEFVQSKKMMLMK